MITEVFLSKEDTITAGATDLQLTATVPSGKKVRVKKFGGMDIITSDGLGSVIALQWGSGGSWETIRAVSYGYHEIRIDREFIGDGSKRFRIVRMNKSAQDKQMFAFVEAVILEG